MYLSCRKNMGRKASLLSTLAIATFAFPAMAQEAPTEEEFAREGDIIVTAQRREQALQDVPIAMSAVTGEQLAERGVNDITTLTGTTPSLAISGHTGGGGSNLFSLRGISGQSAGIGVSQAVGVYLDGVYLPRPESAVFTLGDIERIEVLRGPQGTLYGRNSTGGAINIVTAVPGNSTRGLVDLSYGNFNQVTARAAISGPIGGGFAAGLSGAVDRHDGFLTNVRDGSSVGDFESYTARGVLRYQSEGGFSATLAADYSDRTTPFIVQNRSRATGGVLFVPAQLSPPLNAAQVAALELSPLAGGFLRSLPGNAFSITPVAYADRFQVDIDPANPLPSNNFENYGGALTLRIPLGESIELTSVTSYRESRVTNPSTTLGPLPVPALGGVLVPFVRTVGINNVDTFNQELRAVSTLGPVVLTLGANYYREDSLLAFGVRSTSETMNTSDLESIGLFAQIEYSLTDQLTVAVGGRYNKDDRDYTVFSLSRCAATAGVCLTDQNVSDDTFLPAARVDFRITPDILAYASYSRGYQAGGFNLSPPVPTTPDNFDPETVDAFEIGLKSQFLDGRVTLNLSAFHYEYRDLQVKIQFAPALIDIRNAGRAKIDGFEVSLNAQLSDIFSIDGSIAYTDARYADYCEPASPSSPALADPACTNDAGQPGFQRSGNALLNAPQWTAGAGLNFILPIGSGNLRGRLSYSYQSETFFSAANSNPASPMHRIDARLGYQLESGLEIYAYGRNLTNQERETFIFQLSPGNLSNSLNDPRTYGIGLRYRF
jgi:iron complex outermembrane recepter protein